MILVYSRAFMKAQKTYQLTALDASSGVENATNPDPLLIPFGSRITFT
jgi:hypothetical protein